MLRIQILFMFKLDLNYKQTFDLKNIHFLFFTYFLIDNSNFRQVHNLNNRTNEYKTKIF